MNVAEVDPAGTTTLDGTDTTLVLKLDSITLAPVEGAAADSLMVPVKGEPPVRLVGLKEREIVTPPFFTKVRTELEVAPFIAAATVAALEDETFFVSIAKVALDCPSGIVIVLGNIVCLVLLLSVTI